jgi:hypothetical protein
LLGGAAAGAVSSGRWIDALDTVAGSVGRGRGNGGEDAVRW